MNLRQCCSAFFLYFIVLIGTKDRCLIEQLFVFTYIRRQVYVDGILGLFQITSKIEHVNLDTFVSSN